MINLIVYNFCIVIILLLIFATLNTTITNHKDWGGPNGPKKDDSYSKRLFNMFYFSSTTFSTAGYGDIYPVSVKAKLLVLLQQLILISKILYLLIKGIKKIKSLKMFLL